MRKRVFLFIIAMLLAGCATLSDKKPINTSGLEKLSNGLSKQAVLSIMGTEPTNASYKDYAGYIQCFTIDNPYRTETLGGTGKALDVLYYVTTIKNEDREIIDSDLTPFVFDEDRLIGTGWGFLKDICKQKGIQLNQENP